LAVFFIIDKTKVWLSLDQITKSKVESVEVTAVNDGWHNRYCTFLIQSVV